jgi:hypothetical protein
MLEYSGVLDWILLGAKASIDEKSSNDKMKRIM